MVKYIRLPLLFFFLAALLGVFLRWQFILPTPGIHYTYFLHAHSHVMFLGWVFNALYIAFTLGHIRQNEQKTFELIFIMLQLLVVAMLISFPMQGYGMFSIIFSTLHTLLAVTFIIIFYRKTKNADTGSVWFARTSLLFFLISTVGPFSLGYLMANGLGQSQWYYFSIYYYLHFQYNGFFLFGVFSLFFHLLERKQFRYDVQKAKTIGRWMATACVPTYLLSVLWAKPGLAFNVIAGLAALAQVYALGLLIIFLNKNPVKKYFSKPVYFYLIIGLSAVILKVILQLLSSLPAVAAMAYEFRPIVIAYLHLVLIGIISIILLAWYADMNFINQNSTKKNFALFLIAFVGTEIGLILQPWWGRFASIVALPSAQFLLLFSVLLWLSCFLFYISRNQKN